MLQKAIFNKCVPIVSAEEVKSCYVGLPWMAGIIPDPGVSTFTALQPPVSALLSIGTSQTNHKWSW